MPQDRLRKLTDDNRELAANLKRDLVQPQPTRTSTKPGSSSRRGKGQGSDLGSGRGSEERHSSVPAGGRGTKRGKDNDVEKVGSLLFIFFYSPVFPPHDPAQDSATGFRCSTLPTSVNIPQQLQQQFHGPLASLVSGQPSDPSSDRGCGITTIQLGGTYKGNLNVYRRAEASAFI